MFAVAQTAERERDLAPVVDGEQPRPQAILALVQLDNADAIAAAFGPAAVLRARETLARRAEVFVADTGVMQWDGECLLILIGDPLCLTGRARPDAALLALLQGAMTSALVSDPIEVGDTALVALATVVLRAFDALPVAVDDEALGDLAGDLLRRAAAATPRLAPVLPGAVWREGYRAKMAQAVLVANCIREGSVALAWQAVRDAEADGAILYREGLLRLLNARGRDRPIGSLVGALEEIGLVRALDAHVVGLTIDRLRSDRLLTLGCNISAQSALLDGWWAPIVAALKNDRDVARRLVIEITESAPFTNMGLAVEFVDHLRSLGCRIALDDFGAGHASIRYIHALRPDIIKIDGLYLKIASGMLGSANRPLLDHLVGLARAVATDVVVEGVEDAVTLEIGRQSGANWFQGYHLGAPALALSHARPRSHAQPAPYCSSLSSDGAG